MINPHILEFLPAGRQAVLLEALLHPCPEWLAQLRKVQASGVVAIEEPQRGRDVPFVRGTISTSPGTELDFTEVCGI